MFKSSISSETAPGETASAATSPQRVSPLCDIVETGTTVVLTADMPGVPADGVDVRLHGDVLTLSGRSATKEPASFTPLWREYAPRDYERAFRVGQDIDPDKIQASIKDGVLRVQLSKRAAAQPKKIAVLAG